MNSKQSLNPDELDFSNTNDLLKIDDDLFTIERWSQLKEDLGLFSDGYASGQKSMIMMLNRLLELELSFEDLKKQLTGLVNERSKFVEFTNAP